METKSLQQCIINMFPFRAKKHILLKLVISGKVNLYSRTVLNFDDTESVVLFKAKDPMKPTGYYYDDTQFYLIKKKNKQLS